MKPIEKVPAGRGFLTRFWNAITPTHVYVARKIVPPYVPSAVEREGCGGPTVSNAIVGSGSFSLSHCRMVNSDASILLAIIALGPIRRFIFHVTGINLD